MEDFKPKLRIDKREQEIVFSQSIKAGKRIYYLDVKKNKKDDLFVAITESKKVINGFDENAQVSYEKHKIFLYKEDFDKFLEGLHSVIDFIKEEKSISEQDVYNLENTEADNIDIEVQDSYSSNGTSKFDFSIKEFED